MGGRPQNKMDCLNFLITEIRPAACVKKKKGQLKHFLFQLFHMQWRKDKNGGNMTLPIFVGLQFSCNQTISRGRLFWEDPCKLVKIALNVALWVKMADSLSLLTFFHESVSW